MVKSDIYKTAQRAGETLLDTGARNRSVPVTLASRKSARSALSHLTKAQHAWIKASNFSFATGEFILLPDEKGAVQHVLCGIDDLPNGTIEPSVVYQLAGPLAARLPNGDYHFENATLDQNVLAHAWALGAYDYATYKGKTESRSCRLKPEKDTQTDLVQSVVNGTYLGRDLINCPANDLGPDDLEAVAKAVAKSHAARITVVKGDELLKQNFPMIHAVGRASNRAPRLIDLSWGKKTDPTLTLVGKGIVFDTGGLNLKPGNSMALMKKDMGGAATALSAASMIMSAELPVQLRVLLPVAENAVSGNAYRPGDVLASRNGMTVEIGNTDAEGRLVLADALSFADEDAPDTLMCFATLTGAARVALGPDLPPLYTTTDTLANELLAAGTAINDPLWRMPFWAPYDQTLKSAVADVSHISNGPFAGSVTAALFLKRFVAQTTNFAHIDLYGWVPTAKPGFPKGGDPQGARAVFEWARQRFL